MIAELITIGDEILIGQTVDTNSAWIAQKLNMIGIRVDKIVSIADGEVEIMDALREAGARADVVIITGGLGPTKDDITKSTLIKYTDDELVFNQEVHDHIESFFKSRNREMTEHNSAQALVPSKCEILPNANGTAPGMWFQLKDHVMISMPGVPYEMKGIMTDAGLDKLARLSSKYTILHKHIITHGIPESVLMEKIEDWENSLEEPLKLAYLPSAGMVKLRITAVIDGNREEIHDIVERKVAELEKIIPEFIVGFDSETLQETVGRLLKRKGLTLSTAESCTGGYIAHLITSIAGSSAYFLGSVVSYHNDVKSGVLGVSEDDLMRKGAVSQEVVESMVKGVLAKTNTDYAIATSGVAGPDGGSDEKPVGTIWIAVGTKDKVVSQKFRFGNERSANIERTARTALNMLRKELMVNVVN